MERRALLRGLMVGLPVAATAVAGAAVSTGNHVREASDKSWESCKRQLDDLRQRMDRSEASTKKAIKVLTALTALSLGIDVSALL
jgi:hypothetical protein